MTNEMTNETIYNEIDKSNTPLEGKTFAEAQAILAEAQLDLIAFIDQSREMNKPARSAKRHGQQSRRDCIIAGIKAGRKRTTILNDISKIEVNGASFYPDEKKNNKAISGTVYDMQVNKGWQIAENENGKFTAVIPK